MCILQLAPGGHVGRFIVWTKSAFEKLDSIFGTTTEASTNHALLLSPPICICWFVSSHHESTAPPGQQCLAVLTQSPHMSQVSATKKGYKLPRSLLTNSDLTRLINSDEIQSVVNAPKVQTVLRSVICNVGFTTVLSTAGVLRKVAGLAPCAYKHLPSPAPVPVCRRASARTCP